MQDQVELKGNDLSQYLFLNSLMDQKNAKLLVGLQNSIINFGNAPVKGWNKFDRKLNQKQN